MRRLWLLLLVIPIAAPMRAQQEYGVSRETTPPQSLRLIIAPHVAQELDGLADTLRLETVRCLIGVVRGKDAVIDLAWMPAIEASTVGGVKYQSCPSATLALWHNHPSFPGEEPEYACYLSAIDIQEALRPAAPPIQIVQVTGAVACWWLQWEIAQMGPRSVLFPRPGQRWGKSVVVDEASCRGELQDLMVCALLLRCDHDATRCRRPSRPKDVATVGREALVSSRGTGCREAQAKPVGLVGSRTDCALPKP